MKTESLNQARITGDYRAQSGMIILIYLSFKHSLFNVFLRYFMLPADGNHKNRENNPQLPVAWLIGMMIFHRTIAPAPNHKRTNESIVGREDNRKATSSFGHQLGYFTIAIAMMRWPWDNHARADVTFCTFPPLEST
uniref:Uncharacterized protein n=1 Tax=Anopheles aquasalis TaxID=42839 RepID=T1DP57_ANOAQ